MAEENPKAGEASETQKALLGMTPGERWSHDAATFSLAEAGLSGEITPTEELPKRIQAGITRRHEVTDRNLDFEGEMGYPTPT